MEARKKWYQYFSDAERRVILTQNFIPNEKYSSRIKEKSRHYRMKKTKIICALQTYLNKWLKEAAEALLKTLENKCCSHCHLGQGLTVGVNNRLTKNLRKKGWGMRGFGE